MRAFLISRRLALLGWLALLLPGCIDPYMPDVISGPSSYLVVEGFINAKGVTNITLTRTQAVAAKAAVPAETRAAVYIEQEGGANRYLLREGAVRGTYQSDLLALTAGARYRLYLKTLAGAEYASEFVPAKITPPIDTLLWEAAGSGLTVYVNSHDDTNTSQYYRWEYDETWEYTSAYAPSLEYAGGRIRPITIPYPSVCWRSARTTSIDISKTTGLSRDVVYKFPVRKLSPSSDRLQRRYSILVQQSALTRTEYEYWELLKKNTESIGTLFDPQPSQLTGNVRCLTNPSELALGYVGVHSREVKRLFVDRNDLPRTWITTTGYEGCFPPDTAKIGFLDLYFGRGLLLPISEAYDERGRFAGYLASTPDCIDCRKRGTAIKPSFWP
ncbi:DUF4249 domain-containing protein [Hymenobacter sp. BT175]|uniref:DUF4249 domain-containing protein n=1 Tax=Hymenobacter translucens TaxID=2886507 RepID=UPI001D0F3537|nr:DUF4249 domain-containing protein [Hymenobacter translucens]MCC2545998.1 DUF4249 domain-containing protein [Hymenobacter translucens]